MKEKPPFKLFGIFGNPLSHTLSPVMQEAGFEKIGLKAFYAALSLDPQSFRKVCKNLPGLILDGFNVTVPYKQAVMPYLDGLTPEAKAVGAVNTVFRKHQRWLGTNTDVYGFTASLKKDGLFQARGKTAVVFGAGGAARAVLYGLAEKGIKLVFLVNRDKARAEKLASEFKKIFPATFFEAVSEKKIVKAVMSGADLVVNATSLGLNPQDSPVVDAGMISPAGKRPKLFFDLIYHVQETPFLKMAKAKRHKVLGGLGMLLFQGVKAFELWTGQKAPEKVMRKALEDAVRSRIK